MADKERLVAMIATALARAAAGDLAGAEADLARIAADAGRSALGPETMQGLPRKLHAARLKLARMAGDRALKIGLQATGVPPETLLADLFLTDARERAAMVAAAARPVPKVVHQVWVGGPPPAVCAIWADWAARHGWDYRLWDEPALVDIGVTDDPVWRAMRAGGDLPGAVDVARYHILLREGGLYLDCDWFPAGPDLPPEAIFPQTGLSVLAEPAPRLVSGQSLLLSNALIAVPSGHPALRRLLTALPQVMARVPDGPAWWVTGPLVFTMAARSGPVAVLDAGVVAGHAPRGTPLAEVQAMAARASGPLIAWKGW